MTRQQLRFVVGLAAVIATVLVVRAIGMALTGGHLALTR